MKSQTAIQERLAALETAQELILLTSEGRQWLAETDPERVPELAIDSLLWGIVALRWALEADET